MKRLDRRTFMLVASVGGTSAVLVACGNDPGGEDLSPTMIPVEGAPPTLAPNATPGGGAADSEAAPAGGDAAAEGVVVLEAHDPFNWSTNELEAAPGQTIQVTNTGVMEHDFTIDELGINDQLPSGEVVEVTLADDLVVGDTYTYYCSIPGHRESGMEGTLTIVEASAQAATDTTEEAAAEGGDAAATGPVVLEAHDPFNWSTNELEAAPGQTIQVSNTGVMEHDFVIDELGIEEALPSGETVEVTLAGDLAVGDTYTYYCSIPGHRESGMEGTLTIVEASAPAAADAPAEAAESESTPAEHEMDAVSTPETDETVPESSALPAETLALMDDPAVVALEATDPYSWSVKAFDVAPGQVIRVLNLGALEHTFVVDEWDVSQALAYGEPVDIQVPTDVKVGDTFEYYCSVVGHREAGMVGIATIVEAGDGATPVAEPAASPIASPEAVASGSAEVALSTIDLGFEPKEFTIPANTDVAVTITNEGLLEHDFAVDDLSILSDKILSGESTTVSINAPAGTYEFHCTLPGHAEAGMIGTITVE